LEITSINDYLKNLEFIKKKYLELKVADLDKLYIIDELTRFILENKSYCDLKSFIGLSDAVVEFIEKYNKGEISNHNLEIYFSRLKDALFKTENELNEIYKIEVYLYGEDKYGIIENNILKVNVKRIKNEEELRTIALQGKNKQKYNILFIDRELIFINHFFDEVLYHNKVIEMLKNISEIFYRNNYNLRYLENSLEECSRKYVQSIIVGNSYPLLGIEEELLNNNTINLSMHSQDLYYSFELAKKAILSNNNIKQCILGISFYALKHDLSSGTREYSKNMIKDVYYPLLKDVHNSKLNDFKLPKTLQDCNIDILIKNIFDIKKIESYFNKEIYRKDKRYYNEIINNRKNFDVWNKLAHTSKEKNGIEISSFHNKLFYYNETKKENLKILDEFSLFCEYKNVEFVIVIFPMTKYYKKYIIKDFIYEFNNDLKYIQKRVSKLIDLRKYEDDLSDLDFEDAHHLSKLGAIKVTNYIKAEI